jgi:hypothetical protein
MRDSARSFNSRRPSSKACLPILALAAAILISSGGANAQVGGGGPLPIPCFTQYLAPSSTVFVGGGTASATTPLTLTFDPSCTYLPDQVNGQTYFYRLIWQFGEDNDTNVQYLTVPALTLPPASAATALANTVTHDYFGDTFQPVKLTVRGYVLNANGVNYDEVVSAFTTSNVRVAPTNYVPQAQIINVGSQLTSTQRTVQVNVSNSFDEDGYILWGAINWGDGTTESITQLPKNTPAVTLSHTYSAIGIYKITVSLIDNGRLPVGATLSVIPPPNDANAALASIIAFHEAQPLSTFVPAAVYTDVTINPLASQNALDPKFNPRLGQASLIVQIPGDMVAVKGKFKVDFDDVNNDSFDLQLRVNSAVETASNTTVIIKLGSIGALTLPTFITDQRGRATGAGVSFSYDGRRQTIKLKITKGNLQTALQTGNATVVNDKRDVLVTITIGTTVLSTTVRFTYNSDAGSGGIGKNARSNPTGN